MPQLGSLEKALRFGEGRRLKRLREQAAYITSIEPDFEKLSADELRAKTAEFRQRLENGEPLDDLVFDEERSVGERDEIELLSRVGRLREDDRVPASRPRDAVDPGFSPPRCGVVGRRLALAQATLAGEPLVQRLASAEHGCYCGSIRP